jgi:hypothetical protein
MQKCQLSPQCMGYRECKCGFCKKHCVCEIMREKERIGKVADITRVQLKEGILSAIGFIVGLIITVNAFDRAMHSNLIWEGLLYGSIMIVGVGLTVYSATKRR